MAFALMSLSVDFHGNKANASFMDQSAGSIVTVNVQLATPGDQPESALRGAAASAIRQALLDAAGAVY